jgi:uncharacterized membrane protein (UPF0127 family)
MKKKLFLAILILLGIVIAALIKSRESYFQNIEIGDTKVKVEVADTKSLREKGLSGRLDLSEEQGMLFVFNQAGTPGFWMKDMRFPLDLLWIDKNNTIVDITLDAKPESYPQIFSANTPITRVVEVKAGFVYKSNIKIGDKVKF